MILLSGGINIGTFFSNATALAKTWGNYFIMFLGIVMIIVGVVKLVMAFIQHGKGPQPNWLLIIGMLLVGAFLLSVGVNGAISFSNMGVDTLQQLSTGSVTP